MLAELTMRAFRRRVQVLLGIVAESVFDEIEKSQSMTRLKFTYTVPGCDRRHHIVEDDVLVVLSRLPDETWQRLRAVHFTDRSFGVRTLGYVHQGRREISICVLPPRV